MRAVGYRTAGPLDGAGSLVDFDLPRPGPSGRDLLVKVRAVSVNPVDTKIRASRAPEGDAPAILGWDAVGEVVEIGDAVGAYTPGDRVWYAGAIDRPGANSEYHLVDERIVGRAPSTISDIEAAALPLTTLTAHEMLFDRLTVGNAVPGAAEAVLIIGAAGGVGSIAIQLARALTNLTVIATASRPETQSWVRALGAHHVIDHRAPLPPQIQALQIGPPAFV
ncbi:MAG: zinc-binding alcohol dehydrogenase family protein, partial [Pseudomonadota bacterium]